MPPSQYYNKINQTRYAGFSAAGTLEPTCGDGIRTSNSSFHQGIKVFLSSVTEEAADDWKMKSPLSFNKRIYEVLIIYHKKLYS
jgi:hypothetical protein